jgi:signal transduction histidine kinase
MKRIPLFLVIIGLQITCTVLVYRALKNTEESDIENQLDTYSYNINGRFNYTLGILLYATRRTASFFAIHGKYMNQTDFRVVANLVTPWLNIPSTAFYWIPKINYSEVAYYNEFLNNSVHAGSYLSEINTTEPFTIKPAGLRSVYYPLTLINPMIPNGTEILGVDFGIIPPFIEYIEGVPVNGSVVIGPGSGAINSNGFDISTVTIIGSASSNLYFASNDTIIGYMFVTVNIYDIINQSIAYQNLNTEDVDIVIFDVSPDTVKKNSVLYKPISYYVAQESDLHLSTNIISNRLKVINKVWSINLIFTTTFIDSMRTFVAESILISLVIFFLLLNIIGLMVNAYIKRLNDIKNIEEKKKNIANIMLGYVNHEIRNPLNGVVGLLNISTLTLSELCKSRKDAKLSEVEYETTSIISDLVTANRSCDLITFIVNDILDIRKIEEGKLVLEMADIKLSRFIADFKKTISSKLNEKPQLTFTIDIFDENYSIRSDYKRLTQLLLNLVSNSLKFTLEGSIRVDIKKAEGEYIRFEVRDTGIGMKPEAQLKIFHPFEQANASDSSRYGGIGLGLYLCKMILTCMGGTIEFTSEYGVGSCFWFEIPSKIVAQQELEKLV